MDKKKDTIIPAGTLVVLTWGEYSDYDMLALCRAETDIDTDALAQEFIAMRKDAAADSDEYVSTRFSRFAFLKWLVVDKKVLSDQSYAEWHLGSYGDYDGTVTDVEEVAEERREQETWDSW